MANIINYVAREELSEEDAKLSSKKLFLTAVFISLSTFLV